MRRWKTSIGGSAMVKKVWWTGVGALCSLLIVSGCGKDAGSDGAVEKVAESAPVTLTLFAHGILRDQDFVDYIQEPIKKKYPNITIKKVDADKQVTMENLIATQDIPDFIWLGLTNIQQLTELNVPVNLEPLVKKQQFDLQRLDPQMVKSIRSYTKSGELIYLPFRSYAFGLHYNKSIFDKFGVEYPKNGMTWDQVIDLGRKVTRNENGIQYRGLSAGTLLNRMQSQLSLPYVDAATDKAVVSSNEGWRRLFQMFQDIYGIPGNYPGGATFGDGAKAFLESRTLAMFPQLLLLNNLDLAKAASEGFQWGVVSYPTFKDKPGAGPGIFSDGFVIPNGSKHPDEAFKVMAHLLSDEVQSMSSAKGNMTALAKTDIKNKLYAESPLSKGIDIGALLAVGSADPHVKTVYDEKARIIATKHLETFYTGKTDMNTAMRLADEEIAKMVAETKAAKK
ncbi:extracellular solute-binding protein [Paenibacillus hemerocallicola]|uniref:Extracellular solute-binding protein n=2 Tax=Paenibacillus hemerocallicola TaxID=1172614 RepID=A0A5C4T9D7_9BACL|nr:extracellular solute-binding protein [Paenibacillus hemerocallicola]